MNCIRLDGYCLNCIPDRRRWLAFDTFGVADGAVVGGGCCEGADGDDDHGGGIVVFLVGGGIGSRRVGLV